LEYSRLSFREQKRYDQYLDNRRSNASSIYTAKLEGEAIGLEKGKKQEKIDIAMQMKAENISIDLISKVTGLPKAELLQINLKT
jgi:predicted transposase/invertase (TIGR01784 family)